MPVLIFVSRPKFCQNILIKKYYSNRILQKNQFFFLLFGNNLYRKKPRKCNFPSSYIKITLLNFHFTKNSCFYNKLYLLNELFVDQNFLLVVIFVSLIFRQLYFSSLPKLFVTFDKWNFHRLGTWKSRIYIAAPLFWVVVKRL